MSIVTSVYQMQNLGQNLFNSFIILYVNLSQKQDQLSDFFIRQEDTHSFHPNEKHVPTCQRTPLKSHFTMEFQNYVEEKKHRQNRSISYFCQVCSSFTAKLPPASELRKHFETYPEILSKMENPKANLSYHFLIFSICLH